MWKRERGFRILGEDLLMLGMVGLLSAISVQIDGDEVRGDVADGPCLFFPARTWKVPNTRRFCSRLLCKCKFPRFYVGRLLPQRKHLEENNASRCIPRRLSSRHPPRRSFEVVGRLSCANYPTLCLASTPARARGFAVMSTVCHPWPVEARSNAHDLLGRP